MKITATAEMTTFMYDMNAAPIMNMNSNGSRKQMTCPIRLPNATEGNPIISPRMTPTSGLTGKTHKSHTPP